MNVPLSPLSQVRAGGFRWSLAPGLQSTLLNAHGLRLAEWLRDGHARVIKQGPHRVVYRVELPGLSFYLKHNRVTDARSWLRQVVRTSKARQEYDSALAVAARGVPTVCALAVGEQSLWRGGESYLITRSLEPCETLNVFLAGTLPTLPPLRQTRVRQRLADELGRLVARLHDGGIRHNDLHAGNLLVQLGADDRPALYLIDLNAVRIGPPLDWRASRDNLVMLNSWFLLRVNRADRLRFWKTYCRARGPGTWGRGSLASREHLYRAAEVEARTWRFNFAFWRHRDRRCLKRNRYYRPVRGVRLVGHAVTELDDTALAALLADPDAPFRRPGVRLLKDSPSSTVAELEMPVGGRPRRVIYKRFRAAWPAQPLASLFRPTPALRSWIHGQGFRERALPTARTLAVLQRTCLGCHVEGYLLTEKIEEARELHGLLQEMQQLSAGRRLALLRRLIDRVARVIRDLHQRHLSHRDLKAANILVRRWDAPPPDPMDDAALQGLLHTPEASVWLIDLVGVERFRRLPHGRRVQNLARLNASFHQKRQLTRTDRLRFLRTYLNGGARGQGDWKDWWRQVEQATQEKVARNRRSGRPLE
jgi:tRNA A-37 threonylcarbamoyl transferase component Bud32